MSLKTKKAYLGLDNGELMSIWLNEDIISDNNFQEMRNSQTIRPLWKINLGEVVRNVLLIDS